ncbi:MAG: hypothetical protein V5A72_00285 [Candidatus Nanohaloarchaea archaeon]
MALSSAKDNEFNNEIKSGNKWEGVDDGLEEYLDPLQNGYGFVVMTVEETEDLQGEYKVFLQSYQWKRNAEILLEESEEDYSINEVKVNDPEVGQEDIWEEKLANLLEEGK